MSRYHRFDFPDQPDGAFEHVGDRRIRPQGGGGGGSPKYENLERLYGMSADQAAKAMQFTDEYVYPSYQKVLGLAQDYGSLNNRENAAATAAADSSAARAQSMQYLNNQLAATGGDPNSREAMNARAMMLSQGDAQDAAARTGARMGVDQQAFARMQDATSLMAGTPTQATQALNTAGQAASSMGNLAMQNQQMQNAMYSGIARGGVNLYGFMNAADGGMIPGYAAGGVTRGGPMGAMQNLAMPAPPPGQAPQASMNNQMAGALAPGVAKYGAKAGGEAVSRIGQMTGNQGMVQFGNGMMTPTGKGVDPAVGEFFQSSDTAAKAMAESQVNPALASMETGATAAEGAAAAGAAEGATAAAGAAEAATAAAGVAEGAGAATAAAGGLGTAGAALGAAMPWIGGAMLLGSALGLFRDGGPIPSTAKPKVARAPKKAPIRPGVTTTRGGAVDGPGGPKDDLVPVRLSAGEFVMPRGTVLKHGVAKLEKMRQEGLAYEKKIGIGRR